MKIRISLLLAALGIAMSASAVVTEAGGLRDVVTDTSVETLAVAGEINAADFDFIANEMPNLTSLDLSRAKVVAYEGKSVLPMGLSTYSANEIPAYAFMGLKLASVKLPSSITSIGESAFASTQIASISIPQAVESIGLGAFSNCDALEQIVIPASVTNIGAHAWSGCDNLTKVEIGAGVTKIEASSFARCGKLANVTLPATLTTIGDAAFSGCVSLSELSFPTSLTSIGDNAFEQSGLTKIDLSQCGSLAKIGDWAFARCTKLSEISMADAIGRLGEGAFFDAKSLAKFTTPMAVTDIPDYMLKGAEAIDGVGVLHEGVDSIGDYALMGLSGVAEMTLPSTLTYIGSNAMEGWTSLSLLDGEALPGVPELGENVWYGIDQSAVTLTVNHNLADAFSSTEQWKEFIIESMGDVTEADDIIGDVATTTFAYFNGYNLVVKSTKEITELWLYDMQGRQQVYVNPMHAKATVDTHGMAGNFFIVKLLHEDGSSATLKVVRNI